jgi:tRNA 2-thiouridine synthesizing protein B
LRLADDSSTILLIEDGVYGSLKNSSVSNLVSEALDKVKICVLEPDLKARGLDKNSLITNIEVIDYKEFVKLTVENEQIQNWL